MNRPPPPPSDRPTPFLPLPVPRVAEPVHPSPLLGRGVELVGDHEQVLLDVTPELVAAQIAEHGAPLAFERAGPRANSWLQDGRFTAGIVTCGGLCPGLNNVIRALVLSLWHHYGCRKILGYRYGYQGMSRRHRVAEPYRLDPTLVDGIHEDGGTILGSSRGPQDLDDLCETLAGDDVQVLFTVGGDGTLRGARALVERLAARGQRVAVVGVPKTIDNDIQWVSRSFGFTTAVAEADRILTAAHKEAEAAHHGVGLVKLMGRHAGFIAASATLASADVNFCLVPEIDVELDGPRGFLPALRHRLEQRGHALVVVAEGFGQDRLRREFAHDSANENSQDRSGNAKLIDCGPWLRDAIRSWFAERRLPVDVKYIDPSYIIRSVPATSLDAAFCLALGQHAVHAAMAGRTDVMIGHWNEVFTHVPLAMVTHGRRRLEPHSALWQRVLEATGQASHFHSLEHPTPSEPPEPR